MVNKLPPVRELNVFLPVLNHHHVLLPTMPGTADIPHPAGFTGIITINEVLQCPFCIIDLEYTNTGSIKSFEKTN